MARKLRLEYAGAIYHVISRGNYRRDVFCDESTKAAFLKCLGEACEKAGWTVHAWCVMSNHYHICLETPRPNLVDGMRWLQGTFAIRFNRFRNERGHLFQGRYKAPLVEPVAVGAVCHYIHLNPVSAGITDLASLARWPWTSVSAMMSERRGREWMSPHATLEHAGGLADTPAGWRRYLEYLEWLNANEPEKKRLDFDRMSKDWALGTGDFKRELIALHQQLRKTAGCSEAGPREHEQQLWDERATAYLAALNVSEDHLLEAPKGAPWKVAVAAAMKTWTTASNPWLARRLHMGSPFRVSRLVSVCRAQPGAFEPFVTTITKCKV